MKRTIAIVTLAVVGLMTAGPAIAQQRPQSPVALRGQLQVQPQGQRQAPPARPMYQRGDTWYEFLLKQFNPSNFDYGAWMEERHQVFLDASVRNPYFKYSLGTTIALLVMAILYTKQWIDHRRAMWITAEMMTDLYNHDAYSRGVAREAIEKYNDHIERCNRAIEAAEQGISIPGAGSDANNLKSELVAVADQRDSYKRERDLAKRDLQEKEQLIAALVSVIDCCTREIVGWDLSLRCRTREAIAAVERAVLEAMADGSRGSGLVLNTDNGTQFTSTRFVETLSRLGITHRRTAYNHPEGNGLIERFHRSLKEEEIWLNEYRSLAEATASIARWITEYNHDRPHRALRNRTPREARAAFAQPQPLPKTEALCV